MGIVEWSMLVLLSILWGGSYFFVEIALIEWSPLLIVAVRVSLAAAVLWVVVLVSRARLPRDPAVWRAFLWMGILNNLCPFLLISWGQTEIAGGLASILNAATPIFTVIVAGILLKDEPMTRARILGAVVGLVGVAILIGPGALSGLDAHLIAQLAVVGGGLSYAFSAVYGRRFAAMDVEPVVVAAGQLLMSSIIVSVLVLAFATPAELVAAGARTWVVVGFMAVFSTAFAYILYFRLLATAGATNVLLVTLLIPVTAILLGAVVLGERLHWLDFAGMLVIALGLSVIDGRLWKRE